MVFYCLRFDAQDYKGIPRATRAGQHRLIQRRRITNRKLMRIRLHWSGIPNSQNGACKCSRLLLSALLDYTTSHRAYGNILNVGEELKKETIPLQIGSRIYQLQGLKPKTWYEVKISYPASIPASFSLQLKRGRSDLLLKHNRKLLNTEKLIFKNDDVELQNDQSETYVVLTVDPEGVVAIPNGKEREMVIYNIICDELVLGIPHEAWWVVILAVVCLGVAFVVPSFLPSVVTSTDGTRSRGVTFKNS